MTSRLDQDSRGRVPVPADTSSGVGTKRVVENIPRSWRHAAASLGRPTQFRQESGCGGHAPVLRSECGKTPARIRLVRLVGAVVCLGVLIAARPDVAAPQTTPKPRLFPPSDLGLIEPPDREQWQPPDFIMDELNIAEGAVVAELGAGGGWFTVRLARRVGSNGVVYAEDVQRAMIDTIARRAQQENLDNVRIVLGTATDPMLPSAIDTILIVGAYHEMACGFGPSCEDPVPLLKNAARSLKPQGRLGVVDFNPGRGGPGPAADERPDPESVIRAAGAAGLRLIKQEQIPPFQFQFLLVFGKATSGSSSP